MEVAGGLLKVNTEVQKTIMWQNHTLTSQKAISSFSGNVWQQLGLLKWLKHSPLIGKIPLSHSPSDTHLAVLNGRC